MTKLLYLVHRPPAVTLDDFDACILGELAPRLLAAAPDGLKVSLSEPDVPRPFHLPGRRAGVALVGIWSAEDASAWTARIAWLGWPFDGYGVSESTVRAYDRAWPDGERSPGVTMLTLFRRRPGLAKDEFVRRWHEGHSPMALRIHPLWCYVRNVVDERLTEGAPPFDGIVEEHFRDRRDVTDPRRFYGGALRIVPNVLHILFQTNTFLHLPTLENHFLHERWLKTPASRSTADEESPAPTGDARSSSPAAG